jgi:hypothetical protein
MPGLFIILLVSCTEVSLNKFEGWGRPPGLRPTPSSAFVQNALAKPDRGVRRGRGVRPTPSYAVNF